MKKYFIPLFLLIFTNLLLAEDEKVFPDPDIFPQPAAYKKNVEFWMKVYGEWADDKMVIHDSKNMDIVFDIYEMPEDNSLLWSAARSGLTKRVDEIRTMLKELQADPTIAQRSSEHKKIFELYKNINDPDKFTKAVENLRVQQGIKDRFEQGLERMHLYLSQIKQVLRDEGVPEEIAYLPLVESSFNNQSLSKTRAAGIWQFMPGTARLYMKVNSDVDERLDPYVATRAAARYLKRSYQMFGNWPVALMSYNHGQQGMRNAANALGTTDFMAIVTRYEGRYFGFASRNFYAEFLAACKVMKNADKYFDDILYAKALLHDSIKLSSPLHVSSLIDHSSLTREEIRTYNPALQSSVIFSRRPIPAGYELRLPAGRHKDLNSFIAQVRQSSGSSSKTVKVAPASVSATRTPDSKSKTIDSKKIACDSAKTYVVRRGDTLFSISMRFSTTVAEIRNANGLNHTRITPGQKLRIPTC
ncbi:MAG TPA: transglycosylase SLT domain-containing protein [Acidobacteriota bacterium]|nr:transglycosylase SLT domain-containing protein [Acidobacteriota bacterium]